MLRGGGGGGKVYFYINSFILTHLGLKKISTQSTQ